MHKTNIAWIAVLSAGLTTSVCASSLNYSMIVDAGSSGSRLHLYQFDKNDSVPVLKEVFSENTKPGLSSYEKNPEAAGQSLKKLLDDANNVMQKDNIDPKTVPISVLATAGMRLLPKDAQTAIYQNVTSYLQQNYLFPVNNVETISGQMEGLYGWLTVNYLSGNFQNNLPTTGSIDMGGASTQIAFATNDTSKPADEVTLTMGGKSYTVFSKSFLGLGLDQSLAAMNKDELANTCYPADYPVGSTLGKFNLGSCESVYDNVIQQHHVREEILPVDNQPFIAYSGTYYNYHFFNTDQNPEQNAVEQRIQTVCNKTWEQLQQDYPKDSPKFLANYCANETYLDDLIYNTYQLQGSELKVVNTINGEDIDWTKGAMLFQIATS